MGLFIKRRDRQLDFIHKQFPDCFHTSGKTTVSFENKTYETKKIAYQRVSQTKLGLGGLLQGKARKEYAKQVNKREAYLKEQLKAFIKQARQE